jgi:dihydrofolate reductase
MRKLIVQEWISLDGYATDRNDGLDFFAPAVRQIIGDDYHKTFLEEIDCILLGRKTYEQFATLWPGRPIEGNLLAKKINTEQKIVFSTSIKKAPWGKWEAARVEADDPVPMIKKLKSSPGKDIVVFGSISLAQLLMNNHLVDEYHTLICPILTGGGKRLFVEGQGPIALTVKACKQHHNGIVSLNYKVNH